VADKVSGSAGIINVFLRTPPSGAIRLPPNDPLPDHLNLRGIFSLALTHPLATLPFSLAHRKKMNSAIQLVHFRAHCPAAPRSFAALSRIYALELRRARLRGPGWLALASRTCWRGGLFGARSRVVWCGLLRFLIPQTDVSPGTDVNHA
jgi:hypothetical protein